MNVEIYRTYCCMLQ